MCLCGGFVGTIEAGGLSMANYVKELISNRIVLVPFALVCSFLLECYNQGVNPDGGAMKFENRHITGQYFYL